MSFINFNNREELNQNSYTKRMIQEALYRVETKNKSRIEKLTEGLDRFTPLNEALLLFNDKFNAMSTLSHTKVEFGGTLNEGQFSWFTQDSGEQIGSEKENTIDVWMYDNQGNVWYEKNYEGYGEFGGMDYYELVATMNGYTEEDLEDYKGSFKELRGIGIDLAFGKLKTKDKKGKTLFPALVADPRYNWKRHDFTKEAENDPNQSWYQEEEYDEEDEYYYEAKEVKFAKTVTKKEWDKAPKDYKTVIDGVHYMLVNGGDMGTVLAPVEISEAEVNEKDDAGTHLDALADLVGNARDFFAIGKELDKSSYKGKYFYSDTMMPMYQVEIDGFKFGIINKKYVDKGDREVGSTAIGIMEDEILESVGKDVYTLRDAGFDAKTRGDSILISNLDIPGEKDTTIWWRPGSAPILPDFSKTYNAKCETVEDLLNLLNNLEASEGLWEEETITEAKFVKDFDKAVLDATTEDDVLKVYPKAEFFVGKMTHFFGELEPNLFFKAYYTKGKDFEIASIYSEKGSRYVHLWKHKAYESEELHESNWGTYSTPEGKQADKKLDKAFAKFKAAVSKAHATYRDEIKGLSSSDLGNKSGFNDSEGGMAVAGYLQHFLKSEFMMGDFGDISRFDYMKGMYEGEIIEEGRSIGKIQKEWASVTLDMKQTVEDWKAAEGDRKSELLDKLKALTSQKKSLEKELDGAVGLKDADAELVGEAKKYKSDDIIDAWSSAYGEDILQSDHMDVIDDIENDYRGKVTVKDLEEIFDDRYGEELDQDFLFALGESKSTKPSWDSLSESLGLKKKLES